MVKERVRERENKRERERERAIKEREERGKDKKIKRNLFWYFDKKKAVKIRVRYWSAFLRCLYMIDSIAKGK